MENRLAKSYGAVIGQVTQAIGGLELYAEELGLRLVESAVMQADLDAFVARETVVKQEKAKLGERLATVRVLLKDTRTYVFGARDILKPYFGQRYSAIWDETGLVHSLKVPREVEKLQVLLLSFEAYFATHPAHENAGCDITSSRAKSLYDDFVATRNAVNDQTVAWRQALAARNATGNRLRQHLRALLKELSLRLDPLDQRWSGFGFNKPGQQQTPEAPENVSTMFLGEEAVLVKWEKTPRARRFRIWTQVEGIDAEPALAGTTSLPTFTLEEIPREATVRVMVSALNRAGESMRSEMVTVSRLGDPHG